MSPRTRKLRSGRRQFGPGAGMPGAPGGPGLHGGTDQEWEQAMRNPDVQRALRDPAIQHALYQNLQSSVPGGMASVVPPPSGGPPLRMQSGGAADPTLSPEQAAEREAGSRSPAQVAQMQRIGFNPDTGSPADDRPLRFQFGGQQGSYSVQEAVRLQQEIDNPATPPAQRQLDQTRLQQMQGGMGGLGQMVNPPSMGNTLGAVGMGALMGLGTTKNQGLASLVGAAMAGGLNYLVRKYGKAAQARQQSGLGRSGTTSQAGYQGGSGSFSGDQGPAGTPSATPANTGPASVSPPANTPPSAVNAAPKPPEAPQAVPQIKEFKGQVSTPPASQGATEVQSAQAWNKNWRNTPDTSFGSQPSTTGPNVDIATSPSGPPGSYGGPGRGLWMGSANSPSGSVVSYDGGKTWEDSRTKQPYTGGDVVNTTQVSPSSSLIDATPATTPPATVSAYLPGASSGYLPGLGGAVAADRGSQPAADVGLNSEDLSSALFDESLGFQKGGRVRRFAEGGDLPPKKSPKAVLMRKPLGMPIPILHTTIVIAASPKKGKKASPKKEKKKQSPEKKKFGGSVTPRKPHAIPPERGPQDHEDRPRAHGRVQVPRGSGAAIRGKRFGGIY